MSRKVNLKGKVELVLGICGDCQGLFLEALLLQKVGDASTGLLWDAGQDFISCVEIFTHDGSLISENRKLDRVRDNVQLLVGQENAVH